MRRDNETVFYTLPVAKLENLSNITTTREVLYNSNKLRLGPEFDPINFYGICEGKRHQVSLKSPTAEFPVFPGSVHTVLL